MASLSDDLEFLYAVGLKVVAFNARFNASHHFYVITQPGECDELYYDKSISKGISDRLRFWIRVGQPPKGSRPEWYHIANAGMNWNTEGYTYIAGDSSEIDCTGVGETCSSKKRARSTRFRTPARATRS
jgi:hypothetical protein